MHYSENLAIQGVSNLASVWRHVEAKTNEGSHIVYITEKFAHQHVQNAVWLFKLMGRFHIHLFLFISG